MTALCFLLDLDLGITKIVTIMGCHCKQCHCNWLSMYYETWPHPIRFVGLPECLKRKRLGKRCNAFCGIPLKSLTPASTTLPRESGRKSLLSVSVADLANISAPLPFLFQFILFQQTEERGRDRSFWVHPFLLPSRTVNNEVKSQMLYLGECVWCCRPIILLS